MLRRELLFVSGLCRITWK